MAITLNHLCGDVYRLQFEVFASPGFHLRIQMSIIAHGTGDLSHTHDADGIFQTFDIALSFVVPQGKFQSERTGLGMNAVTAAHTEGMTVFAGLQFQVFGQTVQLREDQLAGLLQLHRRGCVQHV